MTSFTLPPQDYSGPLSKRAVQLLRELQGLKVLDSMPTLAPEDTEQRPSFTDQVRAEPKLGVEDAASTNIDLSKKKEKSSLSTQKPTAEQQAWQAAGLHCSANERRADEASRDVEAWLKCQYMREHLGEDFSGTVSAVTSFGVFVTLDAMYVEGLVHITELGGDYFRFDEARQELRGERTGIRYAIGARVRVQVSRVDLDGRKIDFRWVRDDLLEAHQGALKKSFHKDSQSKRLSGVSAKRRDKASAGEKSSSAKVAFVSTTTKKSKKRTASTKHKKR